MTTPQRKHIPTAAQVLAQQKSDAEREHAQKKAAAPKAGTMVAFAETTAVATPDTSGGSLDTFLAEHAPASVVGREIRFDGKTGEYKYTDADEVVSADEGFIAILDTTLGGWIKFNGEGVAPDREMGLICDSWRMPVREALGDHDEADWPAGLDGRPRDPWIETYYVVLQAEAGGLATFVTRSKTGCRAVKNLLRQFARLQRTSPDQYPVVKLKLGGYQAKHGWQHTPVLAVAGRAPRTSAAKPDTSRQGDFDDEIPF